jgi:hypothetical protein
LSRVRHNFPLTGRDGLDAGPLGRRFPDSGGKKISLSTLADRAPNRVLATTEESRDYS